MSKDLTQRDVQRYGILPDPDFSPAHNEAVIKHSIKRSKEIFRERQKRINEGLEERSDLVYSYIRHMDRHNKDISIEDYAGWHNLKALWSESRVRDIQERALKLGYNI